MIFKDFIIDLFNFVYHIPSYWRFYRGYGYNGEGCEFIVENYEKVLTERTRTMSKPTYYWQDVVSEIDKYYAEAYEDDLK